MATEVMAQTISPEAIELIMASLLDRFGWAVRLLQAASVLAVIYLVALIINIYSKLRSRKRLSSIESKLDSIEKKLDKLSKKRK